MSAYHTALKGGTVEDARPLDRYVSPRGSVAVRHDMTRPPLPAEYGQVDVVCGDLPWPHGFRAFDQRAGTVTRFRDFCRGVDLALGQLRVPVMLTGGRTHLRWLPTPTQAAVVRLNGSRVGLFVYNAHVPFDDLDVRYLLDRLAEKYECGGDFVCGYGATGRAFAQAGKRFVLSDYNAHCVGYVAEHCVTWETTRK